MGKMNTIDLLLQEYDENLNSYGYNDPLVRILKRDLMAIDMVEVREAVRCIEHDFDVMVSED